MNTLVSLDDGRDQEGSARQRVDAFTVDPELRAALKTFFDARTEAVEFHDG